MKTNSSIALVLRLGAILVALLSFVGAAQAASSLDVTGVQNGQTTPLSIGSAMVGTAKPTRTFTVKNLGNSNLTLGSVTIPSGFILSQGPASVVGPGKQTTFIIALDTAKAGSPCGTVSIANNDPKKNPFRFAINGTITASSAVPDIDVIGVANHQTAPVNLGKVPVGGTPPSSTFVVRNTGRKALNISKVTVPSGFVVVKAPESSVSAGQQTSFSVGLTTGTAGVFSGEVSITSNDPDESPYDFTVMGIVERIQGAPEVSLLVNGMPYATSSVDTFKTYAYRGQNYDDPVILTLRNEGREDLILSAWNLSTGFVSTSPVPGRLTPGASFELRIRPSTSVPDLRDGFLTFNTNDADEPRFTIRLRGIVFEPVQRNAFEKAISTFPDGQVTIYASSGWRYSIEPENGGMSWNGGYVIRGYNQNGQLMTRLIYDRGMTKVVIYQNGPVTVDNWTNLWVEVR